MSVTNFEKFSISNLRGYLKAKGLFIIFANEPIFSAKQAFALSLSKTFTATTKRWYVGMK